MNETDQKIVEKPELDPWDGSSGNHASDFEVALDEFVGRINQYGGGKDD
jgi:hypothetical protein